MSNPPVITVDANGQITDLALDYNSQADLQSQYVALQNQQKIADAATKAAEDNVTTTSNAIDDKYPTPPAPSDPNYADYQSLLAANKAAGDAATAAGDVSGNLFMATSTVKNTIDTNFGGYDYTLPLNTAPDGSTVPAPTPIYTIDPNSASSLNPVSSGSGGIITPLGDTPASTYAGQTLSVDNSALVDTNATLTYDQPAVISQQQLTIADNNATDAWNTVGEFSSAGDTSSINYQAAKINAIQTQNQFELSRDNLEQVSTSAGDLTGSALDARAAAFNIDGLGSGTTSTASTPDANGVVESSLQEDPLNITGNNDALMQVPNVDVSSSLDTFNADGTVTPAAAASATAAPTTPTQTDKRIRIRAKDSTLYSDSASAMFPLNSSSGTNGVMFPYTPTITYNHAVNYQMMEPTHANTSYALYTNTPALQIQITGQFTAQNQTEAAYLMASMHFFRTASKMHFGENDTLAGLPPPVLTLSGYGNFMFNDLDCIMTNFQMELPNNVDYVEVTNNGFTAWVPSITTITVSLVVQQTPKKQREEFDFNKFASGALLTNGGWI